MWRDTASLWPGEDWRENIRRAITDDALVFIACFSRVSLGRDRSYQNEGLLLAIEQLRLRRPDVPWLIPVRFDDCDIKIVKSAVAAHSRHQSDGRMCSATTSPRELPRLVTAVRRILERTTSSPKD